MTILKALNAEQKRLQAAADRKLVERLQVEHARLKREFDAAREARGGLPGDERIGELGRRVSAVASQLFAAEEACADASARLRNVDRWLGAQGKAEAARAAVQKAQTAVAADERRLAAIDAGLERLAAQHAKVAAAVRVEIDALAARALAEAGLGDATVGEPANGAGTGAAAASVSPQLAAVEAAMQRARAERNAIETQLGAARAALRGAEQDLREAEADVAEVRHLEVLSNMLTVVLPELRAYRQANEAAGRETQLPDFEALLADDGREPLARLLELVP